MGLADKLGLIIPAVVDDKTAKGLNSAKKNIGGFEKNIKSLAKTLGVAFSAAAVVDFGKASIKAFIEDEKAASRLAKTVSNLGLGFANPQIAKFIDDLSAASGVTDDQLRPAFQALITTTGSLTNSQKLLAQAVDISAGSGVDLATVTQDLANAYVGNTKGLKKYNLGLTQTELKTMSFTDVQKKLNEQFQGSNSAYLQTYAGKMQMLQTAAGEAQETIGGALIQALMDFTGSIDAVDLGNKIKSWGDAIAQVIDDFTWGFKKLSFLTSDKAILSALNPASNYIKNGLMKIDAERAAAAWKKAYAGALGYDPANNSLTGYKVDEAAKKKAEADAARRAKELAKTTAKNTAELKKQSALKKQSSIFDMEQIQLVAALKGNLSDEERKRVELQLALLQGNEEAAKNLTTEIANSIDKTGNLAKYLQTLPDANNPFKNWSSYLDALEVQAKRIAAMGGGSNNIIGDMNNPTYTVGGTAGANGGSYGGQVQVTVNFQGADSLSNALRDSFVSSSMDGSFSQINRTVGAFDR
jgi:hypothetical protein